MDVPEVGKGRLTGSRTIVEHSAGEEILQAIGGRGLANGERSDVDRFRFVAVAEIDGERHFVRGEFDDSVEITLLLHAGIGVTG